MKTLRRTLASILLAAMLLTQTVLAAPTYSFSNELEAAQALVEQLKVGQASMYLNVPASFDYPLCYRYLCMLYRDAYVFEYIPAPVHGYIQVTYNDASRHADAEAEAARLAKTLVHADMSEWEKYKAIYTYLLDHVEYDMHAALNQGTEHGSPAFSAYGALVDGLAVCDGISAAFAMICRAAGLPCIYVASPEMNHSWNAVWYQGEVHHVDITYDLTGHTRDRYFMLDERQIARDHSWDQTVLQKLTDSIWDERYVSAYILNTIGGLFRGTDQGYELDRKPTRAEAAIMLVRFLGMEADALANSDRMHMPFTDVNPAHAPYIAMLYAKGLTRGTTDTTFSPNAEVQPRDYMTFMLRALGYSEQDGSFKWETAVEDSLRLGVLDADGYAALTTHTFDRGRMAQVSLAVLQAEVQTGETLMVELAKQEILSLKKLLEFFEKS